MSSVRFWSTCDEVGTVAPSRRRVATIRERLVRAGRFGGGLARRARRVAHRTHTSAIVDRSPFADGSNTARCADCAGAIWRQAWQQRTVATSSTNGASWTFIRLPVWMRRRPIVRSRRSDDFGRRRPTRNCKNYWPTINHTSGIRRPAWCRFRPADFLRPADLLTAPSEAKSEWTRAEPGLAYNCRLLSLSLTITPTLEQVIEQVRDEIGSRSAELASLPPSPRESRSSVLSRVKRSCTAAFARFALWLSNLSSQGGTPSVRRRINIGRACAIGGRSIGRRLADCLCHLRGLFTPSRFGANFAG